MPRSVPSALRAGARQLVAAQSTVLRARPERVALRSLTLASRPQPSGSAPSALGRRCLCSTAHLYAAPPNSTSRPGNAPAAPDGPLRDELIADKSEFVRLVDPKTGSLAGPFNTRAILAKLDRTKFWLQQVAPPQPHRATVEYDASSAPGSVDASVLVQFPICKLIDKKDEFDRQRALKRRITSNSSATAGSSSKEVQLTWSVTPNDLTHKLTKARREMLRGARINVVITTKAGSPKYIKGLDPKQDQKRLDLLARVEHILCSTDPDPSRSQIDSAQTEAPPADQTPIARRLQDIDWQRGGSAAVMSFECFRK